MAQDLKGLATTIPFRSSDYVHFSHKLVKAPLLPLLGFKKDIGRDRSYQFFIILFNACNYLIFYCVSFGFLAVDEAGASLAQHFYTFSVVISEIYLCDSDCFLFLGALVFAKRSWQLIYLCLYLIHQEFFESY